MHARIRLFLFVLISVNVASAQKINWTADGLAFTRVKEGNIVRVDPKNNDETILIRKEQLTPPGAAASLKPQSYEYSADYSKMLVFTNTAKVWRYNTRGDYWLVDIGGNKLKQI